MKYFVVYRSEPLSENQGIHFKGQQFWSILFCGCNSPFYDTLEEVEKAMECIIEDKTHFEGCTDYKIAQIEE